MSQEKRWGMSWMLRVTQVFKDTSCLKAACASTRWVFVQCWCYSLWLGLLPLSLHCLFCCRWGFSWIPKQATAPGVAAGHTVRSLLNEGAGWLLPAFGATAHPDEMAIRYGRLTAEPVPRNRSNGCPLPLQTLTLSCAASQLHPERDPTGIKVWVRTGAFSSTGGPYRPCVLLTELKAQWWWEEHSLSWNF